MEYGPSDILDGYNTTQKIDEEAHGNREGNTIEKAHNRKGKNPVSIEIDQPSNSETHQKKKKNRGITLAKEAQVVTILKRGKAQSTARGHGSNRNLEEKIAISSEEEDFNSEISVSSLDSKSSTEILEIGENSNDTGDNFPEGYQECFREEDVAIIDSTEGRQALVMIDDSSDINPPIAAEIPSIDTSAKGSNIKIPVDFTISRELVLTLKKNNLCIRPISGNSAKKGSTSQKKKVREVCSLLRS